MDLEGDETTREYVQGRLRGTRQKGRDDETKHTRACVRMMGQGRQRLRGRSRGASEQSHCSNRRRVVQTPSDNSRQHVTWPAAAEGAASSVLTAVVARAGLTHAAEGPRPPLCHLIRRSRRARLVVAVVVVVVAVAVLQCDRSSSHDHACLTTASRRTSSHRACDRCSTVPRVCHSHTLGRRLPSTKEETAAQTPAPARPRYRHRCAYIALPPRPRAASRSRSAATTRTYSIEPTLPRGVITNPTLSSAVETLAPHHFSHTPSFTPLSPSLSLFTPLLPRLADRRNPNLASNKPRQPLTHGNPRVIAPLPLLTPACLRLSQSHYHPRLSRRRRSYYSHTHTTSTSTCIQLAYCSILPSFSIILAYAHIDHCLTPHFTPQHPQSHPTRRLSRGDLVPL